MEEELTPAEVEVELLPVAVQLNYVRGLRGSATDYVHELVESGNKTGIGMSIKYVIENNVLAANSLLFSDHPPKRFLYESAKKLEKMLSGVRSLICRQWSDRTVFDAVLRPFAFSCSTCVGRMQSSTAAHCTEPHGRCETDRGAASR